MNNIIPIRSFPGIAAVAGILLLSACAAPDAQAPGASAATNKSSEGTEVTGTRLKVKDKDQINVQSGTDVQSSGARNN